MITDFDLQTLSGSLWPEIQARETALNSQIQTLTSENETLKATLVSHQEISDALVARAKELFASEDYEPLGALIDEASIYPEAREAAKKLAEAEALAEQIAALEAQRLSLLGADQSGDPT
jgi:hypothetical protein